MNNTEISLFDESYIKHDIDIVVNKGDIFQIGRHRLMCGDSTSIDDVLTLMNGAKCDIGFTSPPYNSGKSNMNYKYGSWKNISHYKNNKDNKSKSKYYNFCISVLNNYSKIVNEESHSLFWNVMYNANSRSDYGKIIFSAENPFEVQETIIWNKISGFAVANKNILSRNCEFIFLLSKNKKYRTNQQKNNVYWCRWDIISQHTQNLKEKHRACFPLKLPAKAILDFSKKNDNIVDLFIGTGTTMLASEMTGRICYGMEIEPDYCKAAIKKMYNNNNQISIKKNGEELNSPK